jgi:hypothetical protein
MQEYRIPFRRVAAPIGDASGSEVLRSFKTRIGGYRKEKEQARQREGGTFV